MLVFEPSSRNQNILQLPAQSLDSLNGKVVGFIDNAKPNFNFLVDDVAEALIRTHGVKAVIKHRKPGQIPVAEKALADLVAQCDAVITGSGD